MQVAGVNVPTGQGINITSGNLGTGSQGGVINVLGDRVALVNANLNASGINGGGTIRVGGEYRGGGVNPFNSRITYVDSRSFLNADAVNSGNGGRVIVWADDTTRFYGNISGRGITGSGGFVEVSGKVNLAFDGRVELPGANGLNGTLLLDPTDIIIQAGLGNGDGSLPNIAIGTLPDPMTISAGALAAIAPTTAVDIRASNNITFNVPVTFAACTTGTCGAISFIAGGIFNTNGNDITAVGRDFRVAAGSIIARDINTSSFTTLRNGGSVNLLTNNGSITTRDINTGSVVIGAPTGNGGQIDLNAFNGNISARDISSGTGTDSGNAGLGGNILISAPNGSFNATGNVDSRSVTFGTPVAGNSSDAGNITINAQSISVGTALPNTGIIAAYSCADRGSSGNGGVIDLRATNGGVDLAALFTVTGASNTPTSTSRNGGNVFIDATGDINIRGVSGTLSPTLGGTLFPIAIYTRSASTGNSSGNAGNITVNSSGGSFTSSFLGQINSNSSVGTTGNSGNGGNISITAQNVSTGGITSESQATTGDSGNGGRITVTATNGNINANSIGSGSLVLGSPVAGTGGNAGNGGDVQLTATNGGINPLAIIADSLSIVSGNSGNGGNITLDSTGNITLDGVPLLANPYYSSTLSLTTASLSTTGNSGLGGNIRITSQNINARDIYSNSHTTTGNSGNGGRIAVTATNGSINTDLINSGSSVGTGRAGNAGAVEFRATNGGINALAIVADAISNGISNGNGNSGNGGNVTLDSTGDITLTGASNPRIGPARGAYGTSIISLTSLSYSVGGNTGRGGDIRIAAQNVNARGIASHSHVIGSGNNGSAGNINISAPTGSVTTDLIDANMYTDTNSNFPNAGSNFGSSAGNIDIEAQDVRTGDVTAYASVSNLSGVMSPFLGSGNGGNINITATRGNINSASLASNSFSNFSSSGNGGNINLRALNGSMTTGGLINATTYVSTGSNFGSSGGNINIQAQDVRTSSEVASYANGFNLGGVTGFSGNAGNGGNIDITATRGDINSTNLLADSRSDLSSGNGGNVNLNLPTGNGGKINLNAPNGSITLSVINTQSGDNITFINRSAGIGGNINVNAGNLFLVSSPVVGIYSIVTRGGSGDGSINITHGGSTNVPFLVGSATNNGTLGIISSGSGANTINNLVVPVPPAVNYYGTNITIRTTAPTPPPSIPTPPPTPPVSPPVTIPEPIDPNPPRTPAPVVVGTPPPILIPATTPLLSPIPTPQTPPPTVVVTLPVVPTITIPTLPPSPPPVPPALVLDRPILDPTSPGVQSPISLTAANSDIPIIDRIPVNNLNDRIRLLDDPFKEEFQLYTGLADEIATLDVNQAQDILNRITRQTNVKPALIYVFFSPANDTAANNRSVSSARSQLFRNPSDTDVLEIVLVPPTGDLVRVRYNGLTRPQVLQSAGELTRGVFRRHLVYANASKRMYDLIISRLEEDLKRLKIDNLVFLMDRGLRSMPIAAMQNKDNRFIIEDYSVALMPSLTLTDTTYSSLKDSQVMAMGADRFVVDNLPPLPGVPVELKAVNQIRGGNIFFNENFTLSNLRQNRSPNQRIVHLATHGSFLGDKTNSYIQLWETERLTLDQIRTNGFGTPPVDLLVLSACETALGNTDAELGFAGLAVTSGVRSALASLWQVSDAGTMGLMTEFYQQLQVTTTKSEALRQAQLAMLRGEVRLEGGSLVTPKGNFTLNEELQKLGDRKLQHPYYWSAFTMIGNPW